MTSAVIERIAAVVRVIAVLGIVAGATSCASAEEECNAARVAAHDAWSAYVSLVEANARAAEEALETADSGARASRDAACARAWLTYSEALTQQAASEAGQNASTTLVPVGGVEPGDHSVKGALSKEVVRRVVRSHMNELQLCYEQQLAGRPDLQGRVSINFIISASGAVQSAGVSDSTLSNPMVEACMVRAVKRWPFPGPEGGGIAVVTYPFAMSNPSSRAAREPLDPTRQRAPTQRSEVIDPGLALRSLFADSGREDRCADPRRAGRQEDSELVSAGTVARGLVDARDAAIRGAVSEYVRALGELQQQLDLTRAGTRAQQDAASRARDRASGPAIRARDAARAIAPDTAHAEHQTAVSASEASWQVCQTVDP